MKHKKLFNHGRDQHCLTDTNAEKPTILLKIKKKYTGTLQKRNLNVPDKQSEQTIRHLSFKS